MNTLATPIIAVVRGSGIAREVENWGAETFAVYDKNDAKAALLYADGIIFTGGGDIDPERYGQPEHPRVYGIDSRRDELEFDLATRAKKKRIPMMGICRGMQLLNVVHGGTLIQHIGDRRETFEHWGTDLTIQFDTTSRLGSQLAKTLKSYRFPATHLHHQAVDIVGDGLRVIGWAKDGTVEMYEAIGKPYVIGTQFHPELDYHPYAPKVFEYFTNVARGKASGRRLSASERMTRSRAIRFKNVGTSTSYGGYTGTGWGHGTMGSEDEGRYWRPGTRWDSGLQRYVEEVEAPKALTAGKTTAHGGKSSTAGTRWNDDDIQKWCDEHGYNVVKSGESKWDFFTTEDFDALDAQCITDFCDFDECAVTGGCILRAMAGGG